MQYIGNKDNDEDHVQDMYIKNINLTKQENIGQLTIMIIGFRVNNEVLFPQFIAGKSITQPNMRLLWHKN